MRKIGDIKSDIVDVTDNVPWSEERDQMLTELYYELDDAMRRQDVDVELDGVKVTIAPSAGLDNAMVVFIDTDFEPDGSDGRGLRVMVNDDDTYIGVPFKS